MCANTDLTGKGSTISFMPYTYIKIKFELDYISIFGMKNRISFSVRWYMWKTSHDAVAPVCAQHTRIVLYANA